MFRAFIVVVIIAAIIMLK